MRFDADLGLESMLGTRTAVGLGRNAWTTSTVKAPTRHSKAAAPALVRTAIPVRTCPFVASVWS